MIENAISEKSDFAYEGHFINEATWDIPKRFKTEGYQINMIFFGLNDTDLSELRVVNRTKEGGHYVDPFTVASNFYGNLEKLNKYYAIFDTLQIVDTSTTEHKVLCMVLNSKVKSSISHILLPDWFQTYLPELAEQIRKGL